MTTPVCDCPVPLVNRIYRRGALLAELTILDGGEAGRHADRMHAAGGDAWRICCPACGRTYAAGRVAEQRDGQ